jgi:hypothetical protein
VSSEFKFTDAQEPGAQEPDVHVEKVYEHAVLQV